MLSEQTIFVLKTLFVKLKELLPNHKNFTLHTVRLVVANKVSIERPHWVEDFRLKGEERWGWTFHLSLCAEGTSISLWNKDSNKITDLNIPFHSVLLTRSDVTKVGWGGKAGNMILQGHLFSNPMIQGWKDQVKVYSEDKTQ